MIISRRGAHDFRIWIAGIAIALALIFGFSVRARANQQGVAADNAIISTIAGSGGAGMADGIAASATFMSPSGLALDASGDIVVADRYAQRIRLIDRRGMVRTVAGSGEPTLFGQYVPGGYVDGPALTSRFNQPVAVAVRGDRIFVADLVNHCIREISNGIVSTFSGSPGRIGGVDGVATAASFANPMSLAFASDGALYVADPPNGVRKISVGGTVETIRFPEPIVAVTFAQDRNNRTLIAAAPDHIYFYWTDYKKIYGDVELGLSPVKGSAAEGGAFMGPVAALAAYTPNEVVYADVLTNTVRLLDVGQGVYSRPLSKAPLERGAPRSQYFRDGPMSEAVFNAPQGVALLQDGSIVVADTQNRRIRRIAPFNRQSDPLSAGGANEFDVNPSKTNIAIVGSSYTWTNDLWNTSMPGVLQSDLNGGRAAGRFDVHPFRRTNAEFLALSQLVSEYLSYGNYKVVIVELLGTGSLIGDPASEYTALERQLSALNSRLASNKVRLYVYMHPNFQEISDESLYHEIPKSASRDDSTRPADPGMTESIYNRLLQAVRRANVRYIDAWPAFAHAESQPDRHPLFETFDDHLTQYGNKLSAGVIARRLLADGL